MNGNKLVTKSTAMFLAALPAVLLALQDAQASAVGDARGKLNIIGGITGLGQVDVSSDAGLYSKISAIINILLGFVGVVAVVFILYAGFRWITASGNEDQVREARDNIRNAVIGLGVVFLAFVITNYVITALIGII